MSGQRSFQLVNSSSLLSGPWQSRWTRCRAMILWKWIGWDSQSHSKDDTHCIAERKSSDQIEIRSSARKVLAAGMYPLKVAYIPSNSNANHEIFASFVSDSHPEQLPFCFMIFLIPQVGVCVACTAESSLTWRKVLPVLADERQLGITGFAAPARHTDTVQKDLQSLCKEPNDAMFISVQVQGNTYYFSMEPAYSKDLPGRASYLDLIRWFPPSDAVCVILGVWLTISADFFSKYHRPATGTPRLPWPRMQATWVDQLKTTLAAHQKLLVRANQMDWKK